MPLTDTGIFIPPQPVTEPINDDFEDLKRHFHAIAKMEKDFPQITDLMMALACQLTNYSNTKRIKPKDIQFDKAVWTNDGHIVIKISHKGRPMSPKDVKL